MIKRIFGAVFCFFVFAAQGLCITLNSIASNDNCVDFDTMTRLWCTVDYKHWAKNYASMISYDEVDFYLYLDEPHKKVYNEHKKEVYEVVSFDDKEIKFVNNFHQDKKTFIENYTIDRYTGRAKGKGTIRHDYGAWASLTYENRDFSSKGFCAPVDEIKKF
ncbi:MAG: hypothetical protein Q4F80_06625 [bacterium]|nr:hypothetical protein [bacterium]